MAIVHPPELDRAAEGVNQKERARALHLMHGVGETTPRQPEAVSVRHRPCQAVSIFAAHGTVEVVRKTTRSARGSNGTCATSATQITRSAESATGAVMSID